MRRRVESAISRDCPPKSEREKACVPEFGRGSAELFKLFLALFTSLVLFFLHSSIQMAWIPGLTMTDMPARSLLIKRRRRLLPSLRGTIPICSRAWSAR